MTWDVSPAAWSSSSSKRISRAWTWPWCVWTYFCPQSQPKFWPWLWPMSTWSWTRTTAVRRVRTPTTRIFPGPSRAKRAARTTGTRTTGTMQCWSISISATTCSSITLGVWREWKGPFDFSASWSCRDTSYKRQRWWWFSWCSRTLAGYASWSVACKKDWIKSLEILSFEYGGKMDFLVFNHISWEHALAICKAEQMVTSDPTASYFILGFLFGGFCCLASCFLLITILLLVGVRILDPRPNDIVPVILRDSWLHKSRFDWSVFLAESCKANEIDYQESPQSASNVSCLKSLRNPSR